VTGTVENNAGRRLRIAQVAPVATAIPTPRCGSIELITSLLTEGLVRRGHDVTLFATADSKTSAKLSAIYRRGYWQDDGMWPWEFCEMMNLAAACERAGEFDVIHYQAPYYPLSLAFTRLISTPILHTVHHYPDPDQVNLWRRYPKANFAAISRCQYEAMSGLNRVGIVYHGIDTQSFTFRADPEDYLLFLGRFTAQKGPLEAIEIAKRLGMRLLLAAPENDYYREAIKPQVDGRLIEYVGEVDHKEKNRLLGGALALLYPVQSSEPFGLVLVEAMACGTPVAALRKGAVSELIVNGINGYYADDLEQLIELMPRVLEIDRAGARRNTVERFDAGRMVDEYIRVYQRLIA